MRPHPGADRSNIAAALRDVHADLLNLSIANRAHQYLAWANAAARRLRNQVSAADIERLVLTPRYWVLQSGRLGSSTSYVLDLEIEERTAAFQAAISALEAQIQRWTSPGAGWFVVPDTTVFIEHPNKLEGLDLAADLEIDDDPVHIVIPLIVVDELDSLKRSKERHVRWRAGYTLAVLDRILYNPTAITTLRPAGVSPRDDTTPRGTVSIEVLFDPLGHIRLPIADDEIVARAQTVRDLSDRNVVLATFDTGQSMRARAVGLTARKLSEPLGEEPPPR